LFLAGLVLSGVTAFPLQKELELAAAVRGVERLETPQTNLIVGSSSYETD